MSAHHLVSRFLHDGSARERILAELAERWISCDDDAEMCSVVAELLRCSSESTMRLALIDKVIGSTMARRLTSIPPTSRAGHMCARAAARFLALSKHSPSFSQCLAEAMLTATPTSAALLHLAIGTLVQQDPRALGSSLVPTLIQHRIADMSVSAVRSEQRLNLTSRCLLDIKFLTCMLTESPYKSVCTAAFAMNQP